MGRERRPDGARGGCHEGGAVPRSAGRRGSSADFRCVPRPSPLELRGPLEPITVETEEPGSASPELPHDLRAGPSRGERHSHQAKPSGGGDRVPPLPDPRPGPIAPPAGEAAGAPPAPALTRRGEPRTDPGRRGG